METQGHEDVARTEDELDQSLKAIRDRLKKMGDGHICIWEELQAEEAAQRWHDRAAQNPMRQRIYSSRELESWDQGEKEIKTRTGKTKTTHNEAKKRSWGKI